jgi:hypothetical protein
MVYLYNRRFLMSFLFLDVPEFVPRVCTQMANRMFKLVAPPRYVAVRVVSRFPFEIITTVDLLRLVNIFRSSFRSSERSVVKADFPL